MALSELYFTTADLEEYLVSKDTGLPLANGTISFYRDASRNEPKEVFQLSGTYPSYTYTSMGTVITLSAVGTVQNSVGDNEIIYYYPWIAGSDGNLVLDLYYIVVQDSGGTVQFTREAWPNLTAADTPTLQSDNFISNQISNPQFSNVFINEGIVTTYTVTATTADMLFEFAPDWDWVISNPTGAPLSVVVQRLAITGSQHVPTSPPYVIDVNIPAGISSCHLRQRFPKNSGLWATTSNDNPVFLYGSYVAQNQVSGSTSIQMFYQESSGVNNITPVAIIDNTQQFTSPYEIVKGSTAAAIPSSSNSDSGEAGYVDIYLSFPAQSNIRFSSIQLIPSEIAPTNIVLPDFDSSNRNEAFQGDYYIPRCANKQIDSFLVAWDFAVNPFQFGISGTITNPPVSATAPYICDQTIAIAQTASIPWAIYAPTHGLNFPISGPETFYLMQYLKGDQVKSMIGNRLSVNINAFLNNPSGSTCTVRVYLFKAISTSAIPALPAVLGTIAADGTFTLTNIGWTAIPRGGLPSPAQVELNATLDHGFTGWTLEDETGGDIDKFAIIVTFAATASTPCSILVNSISVVPGDLPCRPAVKTFDETLRACQYYYEKSYDPLDVAPTNTLAGIIVAEQGVFVGAFAPNQQEVTAYPHYIEVFYKTIKRVPAPTIKIYATDTTLNNVQLRTYGGSNSGGTGVTVNVPLTNWNVFTVSQWAFVYQPADIRTALGSSFIGTTGPFNQGQAEAIVLFQYVVDARLAIV